MGNGKGAADAVKEEPGWLKVLFAVLAAADASLIAWPSINYAVGRKIAELKTLSWPG